MQAIFLIYFLVILCREISLKEMGFEKVNPEIPPKEIDKKTLKAMRIHGIFLQLRERVT